MTKDNLKALVQLLRTYDHGFLSREEALHISQPFGFDAVTWVHKASPDDFKGLSLSDGRSEADGVGAHDLAVQICRHCGVPFMQMEGRGFQLRAACDALDRWLSQERRP